MTFSNGVFTVSNMGHLLSSSLYGSLTEICSAQSIHWAIPLKHRVHPYGWE